MLLSQAQIDAAPAGTVKWFFVLVFALIVVAGAITGIIASFRRPAKVKMDDEPPIAVLKASPRYNHALAESRHRGPAGTWRLRARRVRFRRVRGRRELGT